MEEAAKLGKPVFVLDRPNPINGNDVEGPIADEDKLSFIAAHTMPVRYGMTIGELAQMMNAERKIGADLRVIKMENWSRAMWFDETGQTWVNPSPNMRSLTEATLYPGIGLLETTNVSASAAGPTRLLRSSVLRGSTARSSRPILTGEICVACDSCRSDSSRTHRYLRTSR